MAHRMTPVASAAKTHAVALQDTVKPAKPAKTAGTRARPAKRATVANQAAAVAAPAGARPHKAVKADKAAKAGKAEKSEKAADKVKKPALTRPQLVRDGFTMPAEDFALIAALKSRTMAAQRETKKSELLRAGLRALAALDDTALLAVLGQLAPVQVGRPKKAR